MSPAFHKTQLKFLKLISTQSIGYLEDLPITNKGILYFESFFSDVFSDVNKCIILWEERLPKVYTVL